MLVLRWYQFTWFAHSDFLYGNGWADQLLEDISGRATACWLATSKMADHGDLESGRVQGIIIQTL